MTSSSDEAQEPRSTSLPREGEEPEPRPPSRPPPRIGRYRLLEEIGSGGMGVIYEAVDADLGRRLAIKMVRRDRGSSNHTARQERLLREAQALAKLEHPAIVTVHDVGLVGDAVFLAMAYIDGTTLAQWLEAGPRPWRQIVSLFIEVGYGLAAAHEADLLHRDFKPSNVLVDRRGRPHIVDFGLAKQLDASNDVPDEPTGSEPFAVDDRLTRDGQRLGTPAYMSPEQRDGDDVDARSDQYSFCLSLRRALTTSGGRVPLVLRRALSRGLASDPERRWPSMRALLSSLQRALRVRGYIVVAGLLVAVATSGLALALRDDGIELGAIEAERERPERPRSQGPILHWSFDEGEGNVLHDAVDPGSDATLMGDPQWTTEVAPIRASNPWALRFDGRDDEALLKSIDLANFDHDEDFTIALWIKPDPTQPEATHSDNDIVDKWSAEGQFPFTIRYINQTASSDLVGRLRVARYAAPDLPKMTSKRRLDDGSFHHVAFVKRGDRLLLYIDGALDSETLDTTSGTTRTGGLLSIGRRQVARNHFAGVIDDLFIYERGLSATEVQALRQQED